MRPFPARVNRAIIFGAACWALSIVFFVDQAIVQAASAAPYSVTTNLISDLGNSACKPDICSPLHAFMNATFVVVGVLHVLGAITTFRAWPRPRVSTLGIWLLVVAGDGLIVAGLAPENLNAAAHTTGALIGLISLNLAMILLGLAVVGTVRWLGVMALVAGIAGFIGFGLFLDRAGLAPVGLAERIADYPATAMVVIVGTFLLASAVAGRRPTVGPAA